MIQDYWLDGGVVITRYYGNVTGADLNTSALFKSGDGRLDTVKFIVGDWLDSETPNLRLEDIEALVAFLEPISRICPKAKAATIVRPDKSSNALAHYYKMLCEQALPWEIGVFNSLEECYKWFGIPLNVPYTPDFSSSILE